MLQQIPTTSIATIQRALELHRQGRGPHLLGRFPGKGYIKLVAIRQGSHTSLEGLMASRQENGWCEVETIFYET